MSTPAKTPNHLTTPWTDQVSTNNPHPEYPRPQLERSNWVNLNGLWQFSLTKSDVLSDVTFDKTILVPFPVESMLSGVGCHVAADDHLWYKRVFAKPSGDRVLLHFGAADFETTVWVNGKNVGDHKGGFDPFTFDITDALVESEHQELIVHVTDPSDTKTQPRGKQVIQPSGIFYTGASGIWQTVWLEPVPFVSIGKVNVKAALATEILEVGFEVRGESDGLLSGVVYGVQVFDGEELIAEDLTSRSSNLTIQVPNVRAWSPDDPHLYNLRLSLRSSEGQLLDEVKSYVGFRSISVKHDHQGITRIHFNDSPCFMVGPLDQGFWPDGIYTPPTDEALRYDIEVTKRLGFNMIRKHVKVECDRWYYWCDKIGVFVWQDMPSGDAYITPSEPDIIRTKESADQFEIELAAMIEGLQNHPSIVVWVPFNEGWGQFETARITELVRTLDPTRIVDSTTGWSDRGVGDMIDWHVYPGPSSPNPEAYRAAVLGEFGGLGLPVPHHMWQEEGWGYQSYKTPDELTEATVGLFDRLRYLITDPGLSAAIYTQTTDVETEANGLMTYDRAVLKMDEDKLRDSILRLRNPPIRMEAIIPTSEDSPQSWSYTIIEPNQSWTQVGYDDSGWMEGKGGFGIPEVSLSVIGTVWTSEDIWLRKQIEIPELEPEPKLAFRLHHDDNAEVYVDGELVLSTAGSLYSYVYFPLTPHAASLLQPGPHTLAIHCHRVRGGQYIDFGLYAEK